jgi:multidrug transporter EmrE-like cation transporter
MFYLLLSILFTTGLFLIFKLFQRFEIDNFQAIVFNYITAGSICIFLSDTPFSPTQIINQAWFNSAFIIGILFICVFNLIAYSAQKIGIAITSVSTKISLCIPVIFGFIYYGDSINFLKIAGICLALISIYFTSKKENSDKGVNKNYILVPIVLFFCTGLLDLILIYSQETYEIVDKGLELEFSAMLYTIAGCIGVPTLFLKYLNGHSIKLKNVIAGIGLGIPNVLSIVFFLKSLNHFPESTFVFPINNMGIVATSAIFASILFKERLSKINCIGIVIAMLSILLISAS